jgi:WD40 repeat protein
LQTLSGHAGWVHAATVTSGGQRAVSASGDGTLKVWELETGRELQTFSSHAGGVNVVAVMPDGRRAISASNDWDARCGSWTAAASCRPSPSTPVGQGVAGVRTAR